MICSQYDPRHENEWRRDSIEKPWSILGLTWMPWPRQHCCIAVGTNLDARAPPGGAHTGSMGEGERQSVDANSFGGYLLNMLTRRLDSSFPRPSTVAPYVNGEAENRPLLNILLARR